jgi:acyl carrier protein
MSGRIDLGRWQRWRMRRRAQTDRYEQIRAIVVQAVLRNPLTAVADPGAKDRLLSGADVTFDELGLDSLARLTLAVDLDEQGFAISEVEVNDSGSVDALTRLLRNLD